MMDARTVTVNGVVWAAVPSGFVTQYVGDEFGVIFTRQGNAAPEVRFSRYSPGSIRSRDAAFASLSDATLHRLFATSQPSLRAPEGGYRS